MKEVRKSLGNGLDIINVNPNELIPYEKNAKKHDEKQIANVAQSIKTKGFVQPVVIDKNNVIVIGHCRVLAAKQLGLETVPAVYVNDLSEKEVKELRILDNMTNESPWDFDLLSEDIEGLEFEGFDLDFGISDISDADLDSLFADAEPKEKEPKKIQCPHCGEWFEA